MKRFFVSIVFSVVAGLAFSQDVNQIIRDLESNEIFASSVMNCAMEVTDQYGTRTSVFVIKSKGDDNMYMEFTDPVNTGTKILRLKNELYLKYPKADKPVLLQGSALKGKVAGSDASFQDLAGSESILDKYNAVLAGSEVLDGYDCWKVELTAKNYDVPYYKETVWIIKGSKTYKQIHQFALSGKLQKEIIVQEFLTVSGKTIGSKMLMKDAQKKNAWTIFTIKSVQLNIDIPDSVFSMGALKW
jgi:outer membrane lipoprotein-sorting protein